jgi:hypothetical protein
VGLAGQAGDEGVLVGRVEGGQGGGELLGAILVGLRQLLVQASQEAGDGARYFSSWWARTP